MGIFNFFKKKTTNNNDSNVVDENLYLIEALTNKLTSFGHNVERNKDYLALKIDSELEIAGAIINTPNAHPNLTQIMILVTHPKYFPMGIIDNVAGIGPTTQEKINSALENYLTTTFKTIVESFSENHNPEKDFTTKFGNNEILWHPKLSDLVFQGNWEEFPEEEPLYETLKEAVKDKLKNQKFNWLKLYVSKNSNSEIIGECIFNNEPWDEGLLIISEYAKNWNQQVDYFLAQKQFIIFKRCDKFDN
ncbi:MAG: DUF6348 family protein [Limnohabitans sp.]|nr:DUF6348 family protein [Limnohabitans sp.]